MTTIKTRNQVQIHFYNPLDQLQQYIGLTATKESVLTKWDVTTVKFSN